MKIKWRKRSIFIIIKEYYILPDRTTRGDLQMMQMLKIMFIILVGIGMLIMGIYEFIRLKKRRRKLKQLLDNIASGSTVDQLLKEKHPKLSAMDEMEKGIYIIIGFGAGLILFGAFFMAQGLMERNVIPDMTGTTGWMLVQRLVAFAFRSRCADIRKNKHACAAAGCICIRHHSPFYRKWHEEETGKRK